MRAILQRVNFSSVSVSGTSVSTSENGLLVFLGISDEDELVDLDWMIQKIMYLRIFSDVNGKMNLSIKEVDGEFMVVSQFTLFADCKKGNRPSFIRAAKPEIAIPLYEQFCKKLEMDSGCKVKTGVFGADMKVSLINDGPVTIVLDSKQKDF